MNNQRNKKDKIDNDIFNILEYIIILYLLYLLWLYFTNKSNFWKWVLYGFIFIVVLICIIILSKKSKDKRKQKILSKIETKNLEGYINNFILNFSHDKNDYSKNSFDYRGYHFNGSRLNDLKKILKDNGLNLNWEDIYSVLEYFIEKKEEKFTRESITIQTKNFYNLTPTDFESLIDRLYEAMGYSVEHIGKKGDQGGDLIAVKGPERIVIQAKRYLSNYGVGNNAIQEVVAAKNHYNCNKAVVITAGYFTREARELARTNNVELIQKNELQGMLLDYLKENWN